MKQIIAVLIISMFMTTGAVASNWASVAPFGYEGKVDPNDLITYDIIRETNLNYGSFTYTATVSNGEMDALLLIQVPHNRLIGYAYYDGDGELQVYEVDLFKEKYARIKVVKKETKAFIDMNLGRQ